MGNPHQHPQGQPPRRAHLGALQVVNKLEQDIIETLLRIHHRIVTTILNVRRSASFHSTLEHLSELHEGCVSISDNALHRQVKLSDPLGQVSHSHQDGETFTDVSRPISIKMLPIPLSVRDVGSHARGYFVRRLEPSPKPFKTVRRCCGGHILEHAPISTGRRGALRAHGDEPAQSLRPQHGRLEHYAPTERVADDYWLNNVAILKDFENVGSNIA